MGNRLPPLAKQADFDPNDEKNVNNALNDIGDLFKDLFKVIKVTHQITDQQPSIACRNQILERQDWWIRTLLK